MAENRRRFFQMFTPDESFAEEKKAEPKTPHDEIPRGAVPETGQQPDNGDIAYMLQLVYAVTAQRDVQVIAEPCGQ